MTVCAALKLGFHVVVKVANQELGHEAMISRYRRNETAAAVRRLLLRYELLQTA